MGKIKDMIGMKFGRLAVDGPAGVNKHGAALWVCRCDCGSEAIVQGQQLRRGRTKSCGCLVVDNASALNRTHGLSIKDGKRTPTYLTWKKIINRCHSPGSEIYERYGALGIFVCDRWRGNFPNFLADMGEQPVGKTIDRIDCTGGYSPDNCRWATNQEQGYNRRRPSHNTSGVKNVVWRESVGKWLVQFKMMGEARYFGFYDDVRSAELVAFEARTKLHGSFANHG